MSNDPKNLRSLANLATLVKMIEAPKITKEMIEEAEKFMGPCPADIRAALLATNGPAAPMVPPQDKLKSVLDLLECLTSGKEITPEMVAAVEAIDGIPVPPDVLHAISEINKHHGHSSGTKKTVEAIKTDLSKLTDADLGHAVVSSDYSRVVKKAANYMPSDMEDSEAEKHCEEIMRDWGNDPELSEGYPIKVACGLLFMLGTSSSNVPAFKKRILEMMDTTKAAILGETGGR